jgi:hypothetical protein
MARPIDGYLPAALIGFSFLSTACIHSAKSVPLTPETAASLGISRIIMKPYRYNDVAKAIRDIIDR